MKPLAGKTILVTRGASQARPFVDRINQEGGEALQTPLLHFQLNDSKENQEILKKLHNYEWVFITSSNGVKFFFELINRIGIRVPDSLRFAIIGEKTARTLKTYGYEADFMPSSFQADTMAEEFFRDKRAPGMILYVRGNRSRDVLPEKFTEQQVFFQTITVYDTLLLKEHQEQIRQSICNHEIDALTFTSPSTVQAYIAIMKDMPDTGRDLPCFCIGPTTADQAELVGFQQVFLPPHYTMEDMVEKMVQFFS
ncbi:uroporphyrinogen-III synthase [Halobacillus halophilus]|uniref:uroporphyrinogen-III synthase n=1 Tax=Halobacillus halophilus TaxID=1570 RepID=UPI001CD36CC5|nr:uroporphyrinogen-III synthase [Halobacillus halophilus]MCA1009834.1 uroporphyrinogen-III synthase [Halobacillus halophilus]